MAIKYPAKLEHNNPNEPLLDNEQTIGGILNFQSLTQAELALVSTAKRSAKTLISHFKNGVTTISRYNGNPDLSEWEDVTKWVESASPGAGGDMMKSVYDTNGNGKVDDAEKVNGHTVEEDVPSGAKFTDTEYDDSVIQGKVNTNTSDISTNKSDITSNKNDININTSNISNHISDNTSHVSSSDRTAWNQAHGWGDHSIVGYIKNDGSVKMNTGYSPSDDLDIATKKFVIDTMSGGVNYKGSYTPASGNEYPSTSANGDMYDVTGLTSSGYLMTSGNLSGETLYNGDTLVSNGTDWTLRPAPVVDMTAYLKKDGSVELDSGYSPSTDQSIGTKKYIDDEIANNKVDLTMSVTGETVTNTVGGYSKNYVMTSDKTTKELLTQILFAYVPPKLTDLVVRPTDILEVGQVFDPTMASVQWNEDSNNDYPTEARIVGTGFTGVATPTQISGMIINSNDPGTVSKTTPISEEYVCIIKDKNGADCSSISDYIYWRYRTTFGADSINVIDQTTFNSLIAAGNLAHSQLNSSQQSSWVADTANNDPAKYTYFIYPSVFPDLSEIIHKGALNVIDAFIKVGSFSYENDYGVTLNYKLYKSEFKGAFSSGDTLDIK